MGEDRVLSPAADGSRGIALVAVLWVFMLMAMIATGFASLTRTDARVAANVRAAAIAEAAADGAVHQAAIGLVVQQGGSGAWPTDGTPVAYRTAEGVDIVVAITDEGGKIDLNSADPRLIARIFEPFGAAGEALASAIAGRRERDGRSPVWSGPVSYEALRRLDEAAHMPFDTVSELRRLAGMTPALFDRVSPLLTVYSGRRGIDPTVAPEAVLAAVLDPSAAAQILADRLEQPAGGVTRRRAPVARGGGGIAFLTPSQRRAFQVVATARTAAGAVFVRDAVVYLSSDPQDPYVFMRWARGRAGSG